jgi:hypothetical protein
MGAMSEFLDAMKAVDKSIDLELGEIERVLGAALGE